MTHPLGCLILHGFTSSLDTVRALVPMAERLKLPYRMPILRGHGTQPEDLRGVQWHDWYADAEAALRDLRAECNRVIVCGLSMGGLVALHLAAARPHDIAGAVTVAAALKIAHPFIQFAPILTRFGIMLNSNLGSGFTDQSLVINNTNYRRYPVDAAVSLHRYGRIVQRLLPHVRAPLLVLHSRRDRTIQPCSADIIYQRAGSSDKQIRWFERCGHQMLQDCEAEAVVAEIEQWITRLQATADATLLGHVHSTTPA